MCPALIGIIVGIAIVYLLKISTQSSKNSSWGQYNSWTKCTYCKECDIAFNQSGMHASVYECPNCGKDTTISCTMKHVDDRLVVKDSRTGTILSDN